MDMLDDFNGTGMRLEFPSDDPYAIYFCHNCTGWNTDEMEYRYGIPVYHRYCKVGDIYLSDAVFDHSETVDVLDDVLYERNVTNYLMFEEPYPGRVDIQMNIHQSLKEMEFAIALKGGVFNGWGIDLGSKWICYIDASENSLPITVIFYPCKDVFIDARFYPCEITISFDNGIIKTIPFKVMT